MAMPEEGAEVSSDEEVCGQEAAGSGCGDRVRDKGIKHTMAIENAKEHLKKYGF